MLPLAFGDAPPLLPFGVFVAWALVLGVVPLLEEDPLAAFEPELPPHAVSSNTADTSPAVAAHPLLRITYSIPRFDPFQYAGNVPEAAAAGRRLKAYLVIRPHSQASDSG
jgi:hypothetical protein